MRATVTAPLEPGRPGEARSPVADRPAFDGRASGPAGRRPDPRWILARERTLLAWLRFSLVLFLLGLAPVALVPPGVARLPVTVVGVVAMLGCMAAAVTGVRRWHADTRPGGAR